MLKSLEMKAEIKALREEIQALIDQKKAVPVEMQINCRTHCLIMKSSSK